MYYIVYQILRKEKMKSTKSKTGLQKNLT